MGDEKERAAERAAAVMFRGATGGTWPSMVPAFNSRYRFLGRLLADADLLKVPADAETIERVAKSIEAEIKRWPLTSSDVYTGGRIGTLGATMQDLARAALRGLGMVTDG